VNGLIFDKQPKVWHKFIAGSLVRAAKPGRTVADWPACHNRVETGPASKPNRILTIMLLMDSKQIRKPCLVCGVETAHSVTEQFSGGRFLQCQGCFVHFAETSAVDLQEYYESIWTNDSGGCEPYQDKISSSHDPVGLARLVGQLPRFRWASGQLRRLRPGARILDVGCGEGALLWTAQQLGLEPHGCDLAANAVLLARQLLGTEHIHATTIDQLPYPPAFFDCIAGLEVLEHLPNPLPFLEATHQLLKPEGTLLLTTPNRFRFFAVAKRLLGLPHSNTDYPPHHYTRWSAYALGKLLGRYYQSVKLGSLPYAFESDLGRALALPVHFLTVSKMGQSLCAVALKAPHGQNS
jgi:2-polyprenyl-3-methyl-5-hydroxy-6-metoxy-1,4-benzoquinol methylase